MLEAKDVLKNMDEVRAVIPDTYWQQQNKILDHIDDLCRVWIERSPFLTIATVDADGNVDVSPKGDPAGFVKVLDTKTLAIPDRPGNHRFDTFENIFQTGRIGLVFLVPNRNEVVRVNGSAQVSRDADIRKTMSINGRVPDFAIVVTVEEAFYHCGKAILRSKLWSPDEAASTDGLPTYGAAVKQHSDSPTPLDEVEEDMRNNELYRMYDE